MKLIKIVLCMLFILGSFTMGSANAQEIFGVQATYRGHLFMINGNQFTARDYCPGIRRGDPVEFVEGSPHSVCISAVFVDLRNGSECSVWCH